MNEIEIIQGARELLSDANKWTKGAWCAEDALCLEGALAQAAGIPADVFSYRNGMGGALAAAARLVLAHLPPPEQGAWHWLSVFNDDLETTHEDVLLALDKTLADLGAL